MRTFARIATILVLLCLIAGCGAGSVYSPPPEYELDTKQELFAPPLYFEETGGSIYVWFEGQRKKVAPVGMEDIVFIHRATPWQVIRTYTDGTITASYRSVFGAWTPNISGQSADFFIVIWNDVFPLSFLNRPAQSVNGLVRLRII